MWTNIPRSKGNHTMTFFQLIEYNIRNIFFKKKSYTKCGGETIHRLYVLVMFFINRPNL